MKVKKGIGKGKDIPQDDFGMWISDKIKQQEADKKKRTDRLNKSVNSKGTK